MGRPLRLLVTGALLALIAGCAGSPTDESIPLRVLTTGAIPIPEEAVAAFEAATGEELLVVVEDSASRAVEDLLASPDRPIADVLVGIPDDEVLPLDGLLAEVAVDSASAVPDAARPELGDGVVPVALVDRCIVADTAELEARDLAVPRSVDDLLDPSMAGQFALPDPTSSTEGQRFVDLLRSRYPAGSALEWFDVAANLIANDAVVTPSWRSTVDEAFVSPARPEGPAVVWGVATLPALFVAFEPFPPPTSPLAVVADTCVRTVLSAGVVQGTDRPELAAELVEILLSPEVQGRMIDDAGLFPVHPDAELDTVFRRFTHRPLEPVRAADLDTAEEPAPLAVWRAIADGTLDAGQDEADVTGG